MKTAKSKDYFSKSNFIEGQNIYENLYKQALRIFKSSKPIIAIIQGAAIGGGLGLALSADYRITCKEARFSANFGKLGFHQGFGISVTPPRIIGNQQAKLLLLTSRRINGEEAYKIGLADVMTDKNLLMEKAEELANEINTSGPLGIKAIRNTLNDGLVEEISNAVVKEANEQNRLRNTIKLSTFKFSFVGSFLYSVLANKSYFNSRIDFSLLDFGNSLPTKNGSFLNFERCIADA